jgi:hypothetical protein
VRNPVVSRCLRTYRRTQHAPRAARLALTELEKMYRRQPTLPPDEDPFAELRAHLSVRATAAPTPPSTTPQSRAWSRSLCSPMRLPRLATKILASPRVGTLQPGDPAVVRIDASATKLRPVVTGPPADRPSSYGTQRLRTRSGARRPLRTANHTPRHDSRVLRPPRRRDPLPPTRGCVKLRHDPKRLGIGMTTRWPRRRTD